MKTLQPLDEYIEDENKKLGGKSKAMESIAKKLNTTVATLYRWIHSGCHYIHYDEDLSMIVVHRAIKHIEVSK